MSNHQRNVLTLMNCEIICTVPEKSWSQNFPELFIKSVDGHMQRRYYVVNLCGKLLHPQEILLEPRNYRSKEINSILCPEKRMMWIPEDYFVARGCIKIVKAVVNVKGKILTVLSTTSAKDILNNVEILPLFIGYLGPLKHLRLSTLWH